MSVAPAGQLQHDAEGRASRHGPPHASYRPTHVWGVDRLPSHWNEKPLKRVVVINAEKLADTTNADFELEYVDIGNVTLTGGITSTETLRFENAPSRARRLVRHGDTIVSTVRTYLKAVARIMRPPPNMVVSTGFAVLRATQEMDDSFLYRLAQSEPFVQAVVARSVGVSYPAINASDVGRFHIPIPPLAEQQAIASFLDRETARIDALIAKKQRLIALLHDKRTALISHAVTKGLDADILMKDTHIEWIGQIPAHWVALPLKRFSTRVDVGIAEAATHAYCDDGIPIVRSTNVRPNRIDTDDLLHIEKWFAEKNCSKYLRAGDLVTVRTGYPGTTAVIPEDLHNAQCFTLVMTTLKSEHSPRFFSYFLNSDAGATTFAREGWGSAQTNISVPIVAEAPVVAPPRCEQDRIVQYLDDRCHRHEKLTNAMVNAIDRLREYRSALISAAVTGKIDVRKEAPCQ